MYDIITIGSATRDAFFKSKDFHIDKPHSESGKEGLSSEVSAKEGCFILGVKLEVPEVIFTSGGGGTNTAVGFARQGLKTCCVSRMGDDFTAKELEEELKKEGIKPFFQIDKTHQTAFSLILVAPDGERTILEYRGANDYISEKEINWRKLKSRWLFLDSLSDNEKLLADAINWANKNKVKIAMNPGKGILRLGTGLHKYLSSLSVFIVNQEEAGFVTGVDPNNEKAIFEKLDELVDGIAVMSKGPGGVSVSDGKNIYTAGIPKSGIIDRTGAGDAFSSGFVSGYIQSGGDIPHAIQLGTANATSVVQYFGAKKGLLKKGEWGEWEKVRVEIMRL